MKFSFIRADITLSPGYLKRWNNLKSNAFAFGLSMFARPRIQGIEESETVVTLIVSISDHLFFFKLKLLILDDDDNCE